MPLSSGAYAHNGEYFVKIHVGTPPQKFLLVADTGSELLWMNCRRSQRCRRCANATGKKRAFHSDSSSSFQPISCSSDLCKTTLPFSLTTCPRSDSPCLYDYSYDDGSTAQGIYARETATVMQSNGRLEKLENLVIGCTSSTSGSSFQGSDGVLGLGYSPISFAVRTANRFSGRFSYCLVDHLSSRNRSNYLVFGPNRSVRSKLARSTPLVISEQTQPLYQVQVLGISIDGQDLRISKAVWDVNGDGGTIVDSGTSLTFLVEPAYKAVTAALNRPLEPVPRVQIDPFEYCYNWTSLKALEIEKNGMPKMVVHLNNSARFEPPVKSYVIDVAPGVKCLGFQSVKWPGQSTLGNIIQQEHFWEFDIRNLRLRFQRSRCLIKR
ncbi:aspartic proteinase NANA, chloroplast [Dioscorea cayenensis subsp. rotundata]|uniref:Aspartic proteinase NANA, chloroplast n=1 Tax=Dioscorea cayennensis subsp. rotundata TaxID=55577 RepID=A0AB40AUP2_DIOCR|nr:aspartic proteinase NANA, chloroplast [Dioscorea cayenensis subsp. rotundata]